MSSRNQGLSRLLTRVQSCVSPKSWARATAIRPSRAASLRSTGIASSRLPSRMSTWPSIRGTRPRIFSLLGSKKCTIREARVGISASGVGAPTASGCRNSRGLRMGTPSPGGARRFVRARRYPSRR